MESVRGNLTLLASHGDFLGKEAIALGFYRILENCKSICQEGRTQKECISKPEINTNAGPDKLEHEISSLEENTRCASESLNTFYALA